MTGIAYRLWAKSDPYHDLWRHLLDVAAVCQALLPRFGPLEEMPAAWVCYLCALHDIGKADPWFQNKDATLAEGLEQMGLKLPERLDTTPSSMLRFRHEARSQGWLLDYLPAQHSWGKSAARVVVHAINGHHGNFGADCYKETETDWPEQRALWQPLREALAQLVWDALQPPPYAPQEFTHAGALGVTLAGLIILADWIASNDSVYLYPTLHGHDDPRAYFAAAQAQAQAVVHKMKLDTPAAPQLAPQPRFGDVWPTLANSPRPSQSALENEVLAGRLAPGLAIIEAQMGEGKTEGAIYLSECWNAQRGAQGIYFGLPTQATSNQMHGRYARYLRVRRPGASPRLVHGMAWLVDDVTPATTSHTYGDVEDRLLSREWFRPLRRALLAPDGVGTIDQALLAALHVKFGTLRLLGLRAKVLVIDEAHAYDQYMTTILEKLLKWCRALEIPVILLSATLSAQQKEKLVDAYGGDVKALAASVEADYPLLTFVALDGTPRTVPIQRDPSQARELGLRLHYGLLDDTAQIARQALERIANGGCACVLMNTVKGAQQVYDAIADLLKTNEFAAPDVVALFHARFRAQRRQEIEKRVTALFGKDATVENGQRPRRAVLVATQVVEQSLDVDFDFFLTQIAPLDLLLQRSGRLWRHREHDAARPALDAGPVLEVLLPVAASLKFGVSEKIYSREVLLRTLATLHGRTVLHLPDEFRPLIEAVYGKAMPESEIVPRAEIEAAAIVWQTEQAKAHTAANVNLLPNPHPREFLFVRQGKPEAEEGAAKDYLRISTRLGDDSRAALVLSDKRLITLARSSVDETKGRKQRPPARRRLRRLFNHKVNLPKWWLQAAEPAPGFEPLFEGQNWLRGHVIVPLHKGEWRSSTGATIRDDSELGLTYTPAITADKGEEADAGITG